MFATRDICTPAERKDYTGPNCQSVGERLYAVVADGGSVAVGVSRSPCP